MLKKWREQTKQLSENLTTNTKLEERLVDLLLEEEATLKDKVSFKNMSCPKLQGFLSRVEGIEILHELQNLHKPGYLTVFRAFRFPTLKRVYEVVNHLGYAVSNYEQDRILSLYTNREYLEKRKELKNDKRFWTQPQERVVEGLPVFSLVNDAIQIHRAFRGKVDRVGIVAIYIPINLLEEKIIKLTANTAIDLDYFNQERNIDINDFKKDTHKCEIDYKALRVRGVDLHEMYAQNLPFNLKEAKEWGIEQDFFLLDIKKINIKEGLFQDLFQNTEFLKRHQKFLHGFFGDQNIFGRRETKYLPFKCTKVMRLD